MSVTDPGLAASMKAHLGDRLTLFTGSLEAAPLELMVVSPAGDTSDAVRDFWHLYSVHGRTVARSADADVIASHLKRSLSTLQSADASPFQTWLDAITVNGRDSKHVVDAQVLASPAELMRAIRRGSLDLSEGMFTNLQTFAEIPARGGYIHVVEATPQAQNVDTVNPVALNEAEIAWNLARMAWRSAVRLWPDGADPTEHAQAILDSIAEALRNVDGGWQHQSGASLTAWLVRNG